jgi:tRNA(fMet)-specific endonuclease VapC
MIFLDTNVVVDLLNDRRPQVRARFAEALNAQRRLALSSVALFELRYGVANSQRVERNARALDALIGAAITIVDFDAEDAAEAGALRADLRRRGAEIGPYDLLIAAQARRRGDALITGNTGEFARVPGLKLIDWTS